MPPRLCRISASNQMTRSTRTAKASDLKRTEIAEDEKRLLKRWQHRIWQRHRKSNRKAPQLQHKTSMTFNDLNRKRICRSSICEIQEANLGQVGSIRSACNLYIQILPRLLMMLRQTNSTGMPKSSGSESFTRKPEIIWDHGFMDTA